MTAASHSQIVVVADAPALAQTAARRLIDRIRHGNRAAVCLTGGSSPLALYHLLAEDPWRNQVPWQRVHWLMGYGRFVPVRDPSSMRAVARRASLVGVWARSRNMHAMPARGSDHGNVENR